MKRHADLRPEAGSHADRNASGVPVAPGTYSVEMSQRQDGVTTPLAGPVTFEVARLGERSMPGIEPAEL